MHPGIRHFRPLRRLAFALAVMLAGWVSAAGAVRMTGDFAYVDAATSRAVGAPADGLWTSDRPDASGTGSLAVPVENTGRLFSLVLAGFPDGREVRVGLRTTDGKKELKLGVLSAPGPAWCQYTWDLPPEWRGRAVELFAEDYSAAGWIGVGFATNPAPLAAARWRALGAVLGAAGLTLLPFFAAFGLLLPRFGGDRALHVALALVAAGLFAALVFLAFYLARPLGFAFLAAGGAAVVAAVVRFGRDRAARRSAGPAGLAALGLIIAVTAITYLYGGVQSPAGVPSGRHDLSLPPDNQIPEFFAERIYRQEPLHPFLADWLTSDRPPLQSGFLLISRPFVSAEAGRLGAAMITQFGIYAGLVSLLAAAGIAGRPARLALVVTATSGFILLNTLYAWPKLLPAGYLLALTGLLYRIGRDGRRATGTEIFAIGACAALAMLGHGGSFFGLAALAVIALARGLAKDLRLVLGAGTVALLLYAPWMAYQKFVDPPGDRLLKYHLAGRMEVDPRGAGTVIAEAYRQTPAATILRNKLSNYRVLVGDFSELWPNTGVALRLAAGGAYRDAYWKFVNTAQGGGFFHLAQAMGFVLAGLPWLWLARRREPALAAAGRHFVAVAAASLVIWPLLMFGPESAIVHQGTYLTGTLLLAASALGLTVAPGRWFAGGVLALHLAVLFGLWIFVPEWHARELILRPAADSFWWIAFGAGVALVAAGLAFAGADREVTS
jgi:hypothetical protein